MGSTLEHILLFTVLAFLLAFFYWASEEAKKAPPPTDEEIKERERNEELRLRFGMRDPMS